MKKINLTVIISILFCLNLQSQNICEKDFEHIVYIIEHDYPGFVTKITDKNRGYYEKFRDSLIVKVKQCDDPDSCRYFYRSYLKYFYDYHLGIRRAGGGFEYMKNTSYGKNVKIDLKKIKRSINESLSSGDSLSGIWKRGGFEMAVFKNKDNSGYMGVCLTNSGHNKKGQVLFEIKQSENDTYPSIFYSNIKGSKSEKGELWLNGDTLEYKFEMFYTRIYPEPAIKKKNSPNYYYRMKYPNGVNLYYCFSKINDSVFFMRIPGFEFENKNEIIQAVNQYINSGCPYLIVDIRYNGGGQDEVYEPIFKLLYTHPCETKGVEWYASDGNINDFKEILRKGKIRDGKEGKRWVEDLIMEMEKNRGGFVVHPHDDNEMMIKYDTVYKYPKKVAIIINEGVGSSGEQFLLDAKSCSDKVIFYGNKNSAGVLDFSNVSPVELPSGKFWLWYPKTRSMRLPENPVDGIGIAPDINVPLPDIEQLYDDIDSWVLWISEDILTRK